MVRYCIIPFIVLAVSCGRDPYNKLEKNFPANEIFNITNWLVAGPFTFDTLAQTAEETFFNHDLEQYAIQEDSITLKKLHTLKGTTASVFTHLGQTASVQFFELFSGSITDKSNFYLTTTIYSPNEQELYLIADGSFSYRIWLNYEPILEISTRFNTAKIGDRFVPVKLKKGENIISAKVSRGSNKSSWRLIAGLATEETARNTYISNYYSDFISNAIVSDTLRLYYGPLQQAKAVIVDAGKVLQVQWLAARVSEGHYDFLTLDNIMEEGFYTCLLIDGRDTLKQPFYKGDFSHLIEWIRVQAAGLPSDNPYADDLAMGLARIDHLNNHPYRFDSESETRHSMSNKVCWGLSLYTHLITALEQKEKKILTGTQLKTYRDSDNRRQAFLFHYGEKLITLHKVPLVVIVPYNLPGDSLLIKSWYMGNLDQIGTDSRLADKYGFAMVWPFMYGKHYQNEKAHRELQHIFDRLEDEYLIDREHIYLLGECVGGTRALLMGMRKPDIFAGVAVGGPVTLSRPTQEMPMDYTGNLYNLPTLVMAGKHDPVTPVQHSRKFVKMARMQGYKPAYSESKTGHFAFDKTYREFAIKWFDSLARYAEPAKVPEVVKYTTRMHNAGKIYWLEITALNGPEMASIDALYLKGKTDFRIKCENIREFVLYPQELGIGENDHYRISINNQKPIEKTGNLPVTINLNTYNNR